MKDDAKEVERAREGQSITISSNGGMPIRGAEGVTPLLMISVCLPWGSWRMCQNQLSSSSAHSQNAL